MLDMSRIIGFKVVWRWFFVRWFEVFMIVLSGFYIVLSAWRAFCG